MQMTFSVYITLDCENEAHGKRKIDGGLRYTSLFERPLYWSIGKGIAGDYQPPEHQGYLGKPPATPKP